MLNRDRFDPMAAGGFERAALDAHLTRAGCRDVYFQTAHEVARPGDGAERQRPIFPVTARRNA